MIHPITKVEANESNVMKMAQNEDSTHNRRLLSEEVKVMQTESSLKNDTTSKIENKERASPKNKLESNDQNDLIKNSPIFIFKNYDANADFATREINLEKEEAVGCANSSCISSKNNMYFNTKLIYTLHAFLYYDKKNSQVQNSWFYVFTCN